MIEGRRAEEREACRKLYSETRRRGRVGAGRKKNRKGERATEDSQRTIYIQLDLFKRAGKSFAVSVITVLILTYYPPYSNSRYHPNTHAHTHTSYTMS